MIKFCEIKGTYKYIFSVNNLQLLCYTSTGYIYNKFSTFKSLVKNVFYYLLRIIYTFKYVAYTFSGTSIMQVTTLRYHQFGGVRVTSLGEKIYKY